MDIRDGNSNVDLRTLRSTMIYTMYRFFEEKLPNQSSEWNPKLHGYVKMLEESILKESINKEDYISKCQSNNIESRMTIMLNQMQQNRVRQQFHQQQQMQQQQNLQQTMTHHNLHSISSASGMMMLTPQISHNSTGNMQASSTWTISNQNQLLHGDMSNFQPGSSSMSASIFVRRQVTPQMIPTPGFNITNTTQASQQTNTGSGILGTDSAMHPLMQPQKQQQYNTIIGQAGHGMQSVPMNQKHSSQGFRDDIMNSNNGLGLLGNNMQQLMNGPGISDGYMGIGGTYRNPAKPLQQGFASQQIQQRMPTPLSQQGISLMGNNSVTKQADRTMPCSDNFYSIAGPSNMSLASNTNKIPNVMASLHSKPRPNMLAGNHQVSIQQTFQHPIVKSVSSTHPRKVTQMTNKLSSQLGANQLHQQSSEQQQMSMQQKQQPMMTRGGNNTLVNGQGMSEGGYMDVGGIGMYGNSAKSLQHGCSSQLIQKSMPRLHQLDPVVQQPYSQGTSARKMQQINTNSNLASKNKSNTNLMTPELVKIILLLEHARSCAAPVNLCPDKSCAIARKALKHMENYFLKQCQCLQVQKTLSHYWSCQDPSCSVCVSLRSITKQEAVDDKRETEPVFASCSKPSFISQPRKSYRRVRSTSQEVLHPRMKMDVKRGPVNPVDNMPDCMDISTVGEQPPLKRQMMDRVASVEPSLTSKRSFYPLEGRGPTEKSLSCKAVEVSDSEHAELEIDVQLTAFESSQKGGKSSEQSHVEPTSMEESQIQQQPHPLLLQSQTKEKFCTECCANTTNARPGINAKINSASQNLKIASGVHDTSSVQIDYADEGNVSITVSAQTDADCTGLSEDVLQITLQGSTEIENEAKRDRSVCETILERNKDEATSKVDKAKLTGVCMMDYFTPAQVREHVASLQEQSDGPIGENCCELCRAPELHFQLRAIYCTSCGLCVERDAVYYSLSIGAQRHAICLQCFDKATVTIQIESLMVPKDRFQKKTNFEKEIAEGWVMCDKCGKWQHQICALFNKHRNISDPTEYTCPNCYIKESERGERVPFPQSAFPGAKDLPCTRLSEFLEERLFRRLEEERAERANSAGKSSEDVPGAEGLVLRVVSSIDKKLRVKPRFYETFKQENYPSEFPYTSKMILLFQNIDGVEVCILAIYVQEFGADCPLPNQRSVYLSYLDSIKYFRPNVKTINGEALRTFVYHEILIGYLDHCKTRGFNSCYIWACPPEKGDDYIFYCHPKTQIVPKYDQLQEWYHSMLKKGLKEKIVVRITNLYEHFFKQSSKSKPKVTAVRIPYFDGDYWPRAAEQEIIKMNQHEMDLKQNKNKRKNVFSRQPLNEPSDNDSKNALLMQLVGEKINVKRKGFIVVHLQYACNHCGVFMVSGRRWACNIRKDFCLCDSCHSEELQCKDQKRHCANSGIKHTFTAIMIDDIPTDKNEEIAILENEYFASRQAFLSLCKGNLYQYDTLRRAKYSSMMVLYHLHNPSAPAFVPTCGICAVDIDTGQGWRCNVCPEYELCSLCYEQDGSDYPHQLTNNTASVDEG